MPKLYKFNQYIISEFWVGFFLEGVTKTDLYPTGQMVQTEYFES